MALQDLIEKRNKAVADARKIVDTADSEKRSLTAEEKQSYDRAMKDQADLKDQIEQRKVLESAETELRSSAGRRVNPEQPGTEARTGTKIEVEFRGQKMVIEPGTPEYARATDEHNRNFRSYLRGEVRTANSLANDVLADGGYLHAPIQFNAMLIKALDNNVVIRKRAKVLPVTTSDTLGTPTFPTLYSAASWTTELATITPDASGQFGRRDLKPNLLTKAIAVSQKLLKTAAISPESIVVDELARIFGYAEENGFMTGDGSGKPLGVFTASASGVPTSQDTVCGTTTAFTFDGLQAVKYGLKAQYRNGASWLFHRTSVASIAQLKDGQGRYIWEPSGQAGTPDMLLGFPVDESEFAPNTMTTGLYVGLFANWNYYWIADLVTGFEMQRLNELLALSNQVGFVGRRYVDGQPVLAEAFSRAKLA